MAIAAVAGANAVQVDRTISSQENFVVQVPKKAMGNYSGNTAPIVIKHRGSKNIAQFTGEEIEELNFIVDKVLQIHKSNGIENTLILGQQKPGKGVHFHIIPYENCGFIDKIRGLYKFIFGGSLIAPNSTNGIVNFYKEEWAKVQNQLIESKVDSGQDVFCNPQIIQRQLVEDVETNGNKYHVLQDYRPLGTPHWLIVPEKELGHQDPFISCSNVRLDVLKIAQTRMQQAQATYPEKTILYVERLGKDLRGVHHFHGHVIGLDSLDTFLQKITSCFKAMWPSKLSDQQLSEAKEKGYKEE